jgi:ribonuclease P protein component
MKSLRSKEKFTALFSQGFFIDTKYFSCKVCDFKEDQIYYAVIAAKKNFRRAVDRNFARRRLREALKLAVKDTPLKPRTFAVIAKRSVADVDFKILQAEFAKVILKINA